MSINVTEIVLHQLHQNNENETTQLDTILRDDLLSISPEVEQMMLQLHQAYQGKAKAYRPTTKSFT